MQVTDALSLFGVMFLLAVVPGPSDAAVMACAVSAGLRRAWLMILGILLADLVLIFVAILSLGTLAAVLGEHAGLLKYPAAALLLWWGWGCLRAARSKPDQADQADHTELTASAARAGASSFAAGFLITLADPKALVFYLSLFPAFVDLENVRIIHGIIIFLIATVLICCVKGTYAWLAHRTSRLIGQEGKGQTILQALAGIVLITIGILVILRG